MANFSRDERDKRRERRDERKLKLTLALPSRVGAGVRQGQRNNVAPGAGDSLGPFTKFSGSSSKSLFWELSMKSLRIRSYL